MNSRNVLKAIMGVALMVSIMAPMHAAAGPSAAESNLDVATRYFTDVWGKAEAGQAIIADDFQRVDRSSPTHPLGRTGTLFLAAYLHSGFSDVAFTIDEAVVDGDTIAIIWQAHGTNDGSYGFLPATNRAVTWTGMSFLTVKDGQVMQEVTNLENLSALLGDTGELRLSPSYAQ